MARGILRVYLGAAPGVGKTFAMLDEGWRRKERGTDVVVGYVETHGRPKTSSQLRDLEVVPRQAITYRDQVFEEMDLDALLARRPEVALVDELAHSNVPGAGNTKRWQDIEALLDAGISVITTVNIQHLESLNDVVRQITGVEQRETVPDAVVRAADQIELVDMSPEALRRRMAHGNIYDPAKIDAALANYFRIGNLAALRELALLWVADRVDESLQDYRERHGIAQPWQTKERVVVALTGAPSGDALVRRAARMAMRTKGELVGVHVQPSDGLAGERPSGLDAQRALLEELGGRFHQVPGSDVAAALVQVARAENATQIVLGASHRSRLTELFRGSVINSVVRQSGGAIDVHVISNDEEPSVPRQYRTGGPLWRRLAPLDRSRRIAGFMLAVGGPPLLTVALTRIRGSLGLQNALLCYLLLVVAVATTGGIWPAAIACLLGFALLNWYFTPPFHTFTIANSRDSLALFAFIVVAGVISTLVDLASRRRHEAARARIEAQSLARIAGLVLGERDPVTRLVDDLIVTFRLEGAAIMRPARQGWTATEDRELLAAYATQLSVALVSRRLRTEAASAEALAKTNELRTALLAAVSHDLRTPLAAIKTAATSLLADDVTLEPSLQLELLETINGETDRLNTLVGNLLDMSRLQTGAVNVLLTPVDLEEVVGLAVASLPDSSRVDVQVDQTLPQVKADLALLERVIANLLANALAFSPGDSTVAVQAARDGQRVDLHVVDRGAGIPFEAREHVFLPFQRLGDNPNGTGVGLGLAVAKGFVEAMDGELTVEDTPGGGCTMIVSLRSAEG
ncbi:MAG: sensor histidine kinase KdpD [Acidobacteria bacterium]|nr:sensor histidine kinase KdpD [Acidobacteriota bacterium]